ncbi:cadherin-like beta sandwich domain-containing protein [Bacillus sp. ISL-18]|uniref:cadherin-like beta sandwich domain-containing protein n=1 Tax=Bacillus sp. ISL-18 TaxID=2819118 RepID=UPI001BEA1945|nr:cadherin-like beta sandwich domain-containing protein [Bacillus sp. ISL-18]MBT2654110.1 cadherin-like beta sandwich domain-containing protein [Bacillus sp. ISL-18]
MLTKIPKKGRNAVLIVSLLGLGTGYNLPATVYAEGVTQVTQTTNTLAKLEIEGVKLDKDFSAENNQYTAAVDNETDSIHLLVEGTNDNSIISINGKTITGGTFEQYSLQAGQNIFLVTVKDPISNLTNTYTLMVTRKQNNQNQLKDIKLSTGKLSPAFSPTVTDYSVQLPNAASTITVLPTAAVNLAEIEVNGEEVTQKGVLVNVPVGKSDIRIVVTAENGAKLRYTIHVERQDTSTGNGTVPAQTGSNGSAQTGSNGSRPNGSNSITKNGSGLSTQTGSTFPTPTARTNTNSSQLASTQQSTAGTAQKTTRAALSKLTVSEGTWDSSFTSSEYTYHVAVASDTKTVTINPTASYNSSEISIEGGTSKTIQLDDDNKTVISVVVTYNNTDRKTYVLVFDRAEN